MLVSVGFQGGSRAQEFQERGWDLDEGLPSTCVSAIARTHDGFLWLGTKAGLVRFDGTRFVTYTAENTPALKDNSVTCLAVDGTGTLWAGTAKGTVTEYKRGGFIPVEVCKSVAGRMIRAMVADAVGNLWLATRGAGLICVRGGTWRTFSSTNGLASDDVRQLQADAGGRIWYLDDSGNIGWVEDGRCQILEIPSGWTNCFRAIALARDGGLWLSAFRENSGARILKCNDGLITEGSQIYPWSKSSERARVDALLEDDEGRLWCGTSGEGVYLREADRRWRKPVNQMPLVNASVLCLFKDQRESVLAGTRTSGLRQILPRPLSAWYLQDPFKQHVILTVCVRHDGSIWGGTDGAGIFCWTLAPRARIDHFGRDLGVSGTQVYSLLEDVHTNFWTGTSEGLLVLRQPGFERVMTQPDLGRKVTALYEDRQKRLWAGTDRGLIGVGDNGKAFGAPDGLPSGQVVAAAEDRSGRFWISIEGRGLFVQTGDRFQLWKSDSGMSLPPPRREDGVAVQPLHADVDGSVWVGVYGYCLARLEGGQLQRWSWPNDGLPSNHLLALQEDDAGNLWCSSENGIFGYSKKALLSMKTNGAARANPIRLTVSEGLPYKVCSGGGQPASAKTPDGRLWFPGGSALVSFDPQTVPVNPRVWAPVMDEVRVNGNPVTFLPPKAVRIKSGLSSLQLAFTSPNEFSPNRLLFSYRLDGVDRKWTEEGAERSVKYGALPPGEYSFRVKVRDSHGPWSKEEAILALAILPRWWETFWFRIGAGGGLLGAIVLCVRQIERARNRRKLAAAENARMLEQERNRIARDIHDDLGASLTQVSLLGKMAGEAGGNPEELRAQTRQIMKTTSEMVQSLETIVWAVRPENDSLQRLIYYMNRRTDELFENLPGQYRFKVLGDLPSVTLHAELRHNVFLAFREALTNSLRHSGGTQFCIEVSCGGGVCKILVTDNGKGFQLDAVREDGMGLKNMRQRMEQIGGRCQWMTSPGKGTTVELSFLLPPTLPG